MMNKAIGVRIFSELCKNETVSWPFNRTLSSIFSSLSRRQVSSVPTETKPKNDRNEVMELSDDRRDSRFIQKVEKYVPTKYLQKYLEQFKVDRALQHLYEDICDEVEYLEFFHEFNMSDTFSSWFTVMELHIYILCCRIMREDPKICVPIRDAITDTFWVDVQLRAERIGGIAAGVRTKQLQIFGSQFQAAFYGYDEGIQTNDEVLAAIVWRRFFAFECDDVTLIERLVKYIRLQLEVFAENSLDDILFKRRRLFIPLSEVTIE